MKVPLVDLKPQHRVAGDEIQRRLGALFETTRFIDGPEVEQFEEQFASYCGCAQGVGVANGTDALELALRALGIGEGDRVVTAANTFVATVEAIHATQAEPILVDPDPRTCNLTAESLDHLDPHSLHVIVPVHLYGRMAAMTELSAWADRHGIPVVEDAAQAHGARWNGRRAGAWGTLGCFSFYPSKNLGAYGDAGAVVTDNEDLAARIRTLRDHGATAEHDHAIPGTNSRLDAVQAAVLNAKLPHLDDWNRDRRRIAGFYQRLLEPVEEIELREDNQELGERSVYHLFTIEVPEGVRDRLRSFLKERGVGTGVHYPEPVHLTPAFQHLADGPGSFPVAERIATRTLSLPMYPGLKKKKVEYVASQLRNFF